MKNIFNIFATSPFKPLKKHAAKVEETCVLLLPFFEQLEHSDWDNAAKFAKDIYLGERDADIIKRDIRTNLPSSLFMPVPRTDLLDLVTQLDKLANYTKDIVIRIIMRKLEIPKELVPLFLQFVNNAITAVKQAILTINKLDTLIEAGFKGRETNIAYDLIHELDVLEDRCDEIKNELRANLFAIERNYYAVDVIFLYKIIDRISVLAEQAQRVGSRIELMIAAK